MLTLLARPKLKTEKPKNDLKISRKLPVCRLFEPNTARCRLAAFILESCTLQNGLELKLLSVKIDSTLLPAVVSPDYV